ncbi:MAG: hypothetical protein RL653_3633 [Pseudomonadota bacterium]|jgi:hypothetical protein
MWPSVLWLTLALSTPDLTTHAERTGYAETGRYAEVESLCAAFPRAFPRKVRCERFGTTPEGRPLLALVASADGTTTPNLARKRNRPVVLAQGGIHAGEIDGKDAGFLLLRELLSGTTAPGLLEKATLVFIPVLNVDGHERFGPNHRPNQRGPAAMGFRVTSGNLNLNRDWLKADAPETRAVLGLFRAWDPALFVDLHVTDGAKFEHDVAVIVEPRGIGTEALRMHASALRTAALARLEQLGHRPVPFYPAFDKDDDPASGITWSVTPPRFAHGFAAHRNRLAVLVETHSWRPYPHRVKTTRNTLLALLEQAAAVGARWTGAAADADAEDVSRGGTQLTLSFQVRQTARPIAFLGYAYTRAPSTLSGQTWTRYDEAVPETWTIPLKQDLEPRLSARLPKAGWAVPAAFAPGVKAVLDAHGFRSETLKAPASLYAETFRASSVAFRPGPYEGRQVATVSGTWAREPQQLTPGALFVPVAQGGVLLLAHVMEPESPDSLTSWGHFNAVFEQKEYLEDYVAEEEARKMLAADPSLQAAFDARFPPDAGTVDPAARLRFFHERHPSWDTRMNVVPVYRLDSRP